VSVVILPQTITAIGAFTALSSATADYLQLDPQRCSLPANGTARTTVEPKAGADGVFVELALEGEQILTLGGDLIVTSNGNSSEAGYFTAVATLIASLKTALDALKAADANLVHAGGSTPVRWYSALEPTWQNFFACSVTFGLVVHA
jgi:hypothetical protein